MRLGMRVIFITGTDTAAGKTVVSVWLTRWLRARGLAVAACKPLCSGGRGDARRLWRAAGRELSLDEVNPWHFRPALAPVLAARGERKRVRLAEVTRHIRKLGRRLDVVVVEGAGGLLSPLGEGFDSRDLVLALKAQPIVVAPNRLGAVNRVRLVLEALPAPVAATVQIVLVQPPRSTTASRANPGLLAEFVGRERIHLWPWLRAPEAARMPETLRRVLSGLSQKLLGAQGPRLF
jgi:dethiobiotin synthetase